MAVSSSQAELYFVSSKMNIFYVEYLFKFHSIKSEPLALWIRMSEWMLPFDWLQGNAHLPCPPGPRTWRARLWGRISTWRCSRRSVQSKSRWSCPGRPSWPTARCKEWPDAPSCRPSGAPRNHLRIGEDCYSLRLLHPHDGCGLNLWDCVQGRDN